MGVKKIDHIGIAVRDIQSVLNFYQDALGLENLGFEVVEDQGVGSLFARRRKPFRTARTAQR